TMGTCLILLGVLINAGISPLGIKAFLCVIFILVTSPTSAHALARGAYKSGVKLWEKSCCDQYGTVSLITAHDVMKKDVIIVSPDTSLQDAVDLLVEMKITGMPVVDPDGSISGIISEKDIIDYTNKNNIKTAKVRDAMSAKVTAFSSETDINIIAAVLSEGKFRRVPITKNGKVVGIVSRRDIMHILTSGKKRKK
ncbi:CBS domain-containing protein, partial [bacterium]|nr:CBS domain-containing protein [bacterium]